MHSGLKWVSGGLLAVLSLPTGCFGQEPPSPARPNIVMILADDQSYRDFGFMGNDLVHTPHLDALAAASARFPHGYVPMSVCRPSLATLLTGLYPHQHGIHFNHPPPGLREMRRMTAPQYEATRAAAEVLIRRVPTLPRILARHGYTCLQTGKHWEGHYRTAGFTHGMTRGRPADRLRPVTGTREQDNGDRVAHGNGDAGLVIGRETMRPIFEFIDQHAGQQPFFVWYAPFLPHTPYDAPEEFRDVYADQNIPAHLLPYYAEITRFDQTVGQLLDALQQRSLLQETLIVFAADNGLRPRNDRPSRQNDRSKLSPFEDGLRTPILIRHDGRVRPVTNSQVVETVDLVPTILTTVGLADEITDDMPGHNLLSMETSSSTETQHAAFGAIYPNDAMALGQPSKHVRARWMRFGAYKLIVPGPASPPLTLSLFNLQQDPDERINLAGRQDQQHRLATMTNRLNAWWDGTDDALVASPSPIGN